MESLTSQSLSFRPPIVVVLGHVDHGKTTLLDYIRKSHIASREAGGITQGIGASEINLADGKRITFIDTPGHAAFSNMRSQGARVADIAILVVGADDGVKPQTKEALEIIFASKVPFIVAITKSDLPSANSQQVKSQLEKEGVLFEGSGGEVPLVEVSGKTGKGVEELLETIALLSEVKEVTGLPANALEAVIIEVGHDKRGATASMIIRDGSLKVGDEVVSQDQEAKVRAIFDSLGNSVRVVGPGEPCLILGFEKPPILGSKVWHKGDNVEIQTTKNEKGITQQSSGQDSISVVIKAKNRGSLDAIISGLPGGIIVAHFGVGMVSESDVFLAKDNGAKIFAFELSVSSSVLRLAETEGVKVETFNIIYKLFERIDELLKGEKVEVIGKADVVATFPFDGKKVAGSKVTFGLFTPGMSLELTRNEKKIGDAKIVSIKKHKSTVNAVKEGEECGILISPQLDFKPGDVLTSLRK